LKRIARVFPRRTSYTPDDDLAFVGIPLLEWPDVDEVHISVTFAWDLPEAYRLADEWAKRYTNVKIGGPALDSPTEGFTPGLYVKRGVTFTSRGCNNHCPFCFVPKREGKLTLLDPIADGYIIQDNNFLQCPREHRLKTYEMLSRQRRFARFAGGLQASLITDEIADEFRSLRIAEVFLAGDNAKAVKHVAEAARKLSFLPRHKLRCYALIGYGDETIPQATERLEALWDAGVMPFAQLYKPADYTIDWSREWRQLARSWSRPAAMKAMHRD
jgi:radical SAM superfamily enzyme YgiQ (UPF0313 family)